MRFLVAVFLLVFLRALPAQHSGGDVAKEYNQYVTAAEDALLRHIPYTALEYYQKAFGVRAEPFNNDLYNAALAARAAHRPALLRDYLLQLARQGTPLRFFDRQQRWLDHPALNWLTLRGELLREITRHQQSFDEGLADCFERVAYRDQVIRTANPPGDVRLIQDSLNILGLLDCIDYYGFPAQRQLRLATPMDVRYPYYVPLLHELQQVNLTGYDRFGLLPLLDSLAGHGMIEPQIYIGLISTQHHRITDSGGYGTTSVIALHDGTNDLYRIVYPFATVQRYEANRERLGIRSFRKHTALLIDYFSGRLGEDFPYSIPRHELLVTYPVEITDVLTLEAVGRAPATR